MKKKVGKVTPDSYGYIEETLRTMVYVTKLKILGVERHELLPAKHSNTTEQFSSREANSRSA